MFANTAEDESTDRVEGVSVAAPKNPNATAPRGLCPDDAVWGNPPLLSRSGCKVVVISCFVFMRLGEEPTDSDDCAASGPTGDKGLLRRTKLPVTFKGTNTVRKTPYLGRLLAGS